MTAQGPEGELPKNFTDFGNYDTTEQCTVSEVKVYEYEKGLFVPLLAGHKRLTIIRTKARGNIMGWKEIVAGDKRGT